MLDREVKHDFTKVEVEALVDEVLDQWDDDDEEGERNGRRSNLGIDRENLGSIRTSIPDSLPQLMPGIYGSISHVIPADNSSR